MSEVWTAEAQFDWERYLQGKGAVRSLHSRRDEYLLSCPDCGKLKLAANVRKRAWRCFVCGDGGRDSAASLIVKLEGVSWQAALAHILSGNRVAIGRIDRITQALEPEAPPIRRPQPIPWPEGYRTLGPWCKPSGQSFIAQDSMRPATSAEMAQAAVYCAQRGIVEDVVREMQLGICVSGRMRNRLIFPVLDGAGQLLFYQGRAMWQPRPMERHIKILSPVQERDENDQPLTCGPGDCLLNLQYLVRRGGLDRVLVVEGPTDCAHAWPDVVATHGKRITARQIEMLVQAGVKALDLGYDTDAPKTDRRGRPIPGGSEAMYEMAPILTDFFEVRIVHFPMGQDPGDLTKDEIEMYRAQALKWGAGERLSRIVARLDDR